MHQYGFDLSTRTELMFFFVRVIGFVRFTVTGGGVYVVVQVYSRRGVGTRVLKYTYTRK